MDACLISVKYGSSGIKYEYLLNTYHILSFQTSEDSYVLMDQDVNDCCDLGYGTM
jgi:hypothetical protein